MTSTYIRRLELQEMEGDKALDQLKGLNDLCDHLRTEEHIPRNGEIRNIQCAIKMAIDLFDLGDIEGIKTGIQEAMNRLEVLVENPESAGKHDEILGEKIPDTERQPMTFDAVVSGIYERSLESGVCKIS